MSSDGAPRANEMVSAMAPSMAQPRRSAPAQARDGEVAAAAAARRPHGRHAGAAREGERGEGGAPQAPAEQPAGAEPAVAAAVAAQPQHDPSEARRVPGEHEPAAPVAPHRG